MKTIFNLNFFCAAAPIKEKAGEIKMTLVLNTKKAFFYDEMKWRIPGSTVKHGDIMNVLKNHIHLFISKEKDCNMLIDKVKEISSVYEANIFSLTELDEEVRRKRFTESLVKITNAVSSFIPNPQDQFNFLELVKMQTLNRIIRDKCGIKDKFQPLSAANGITNNFGHNQYAYVILCDNIPDIFTYSDNLEEKQSKSQELRCVAKNLSKKHRKLFNTMIEIYSSYLEREGKIKEVKDIIKYVFLDV